MYCKYISVFYFTDIICVYRSWTSRRERTAPCRAPPFQLEGCGPTFGFSWSVGSLLITVQPATHLPRPGPPATTSSESTVLHHAPASRCLPQHPTTPNSTMRWRHLNWSPRAHHPHSAQCVVSGASETRTVIEFCRLVSDLTPSSEVSDIFFWGQSNADCLQMASLEWS